MIVVVVNDEMDADTTCLYVHISNIKYNFLLTLHF